MCVGGGRGSFKVRSKSSAPTESEQLATLNSSLEGMLVLWPWCGQARLDVMVGRGETQKRKLSEFLGGGGSGSRPANWPEEQEISAPPAHHTPDPLDSTIQTEEGIRMYIFCLPWQENC